NRIMAQIGVRIDWLPINEYTNDFAFDGSPANYTSTTRPTSHLGTIVTGATTPPKNADPLTLNMFFVEIVPAFNKVEEDIVNGYAYRDSNGIVFQIGDLLPTYQNGRDAVAHILSHEICHNLGLAHSTDQDNLMYSGLNPSSARLTRTTNSPPLPPSQKQTILTNDGGIDGYDFLRNLPPSTNYDQWDVANTVPGGPGDDPDGDGLDNIIEFMFGLDPHVFSQLPQPLSDANGLTWTLPKQSGAVSDGIAYQVETSGTLGSWLGAGADGGRSTILQNDSSAMVVRLAPGNTPSFMRLNVTIPATVQGTSITVFPPSDSEPPLPAGPGDSMTVDPPGD
ncbi:MAG TPA: matrixin family metalloprotease, partial [Luteolibacter sp.]|nr:matrixin family metalloprotease [Luteolibacter sp.]